MQQTICFIKLGSFSHTNESILKELYSNFPNHKIEVVDIFKDLITKWNPLLLMHCIKEFGVDILLRRRTISGSVIRTSYFFNHIRKKMIKRSRVNGYLFTFQTQSLFDASIPGVPHFIYTDHTHLENLRYPGFDAKNILTRKWIENEHKIYHNASHIFTMSSNITNSLISDYSCNPKKISCVYCGSNVKVTKDETFSSDRYKEKKILFVGIDWDRKGGPTLISAFKEVSVTNPDATLTIVGCSPDIDLPNCNVIGKLPLNDVKKYFESSSVFCLPTTLEPFGIVFLEAMAHRLPIVATKIGAIPDFVHHGKNGYLVDPNDAQKIAKHVNDLFNDYELARDFGDYGHSLFWERYTWYETGRRIKFIIQKYISNS